MREPVEQRVSLGTEPCLEVDDRTRHRAGPSIGLVAPDDQVPDLVEQAQRGDVAGTDRGSAGRAFGVHPVGQPAHARDVGDDEVAPAVDQCSVDRVPFARGPLDVESRIARSMARRPARHHAARGRRRSGRHELGRTGRRDVLDRAAQELETGRIEFVGP